MRDPAKDGWRIIVKLFSENCYTSKATLISIVETNVSGINKCVGFLEYR
jgi:hypothetical protein